MDGRRRRYRGENSDARNESSAVENPDRNQSDSICIMEKARDNVCSGLSARARFLFRLSSSLSLSPFLPSSHLAISLSLVLSLYFARSLAATLFHSLPLSLILPFSPSPTRTRCGLVRGSSGTKELVNGFIWIRSSPYLSHPPCYLRLPPSRPRALSRLR